MKAKVLTAVLSLALASNAMATAINIDSSDNGYYNAGGAHEVTNYYTNTGDSLGELRSFYKFDVSGLPSGEAITSAKITFYGNNGVYSTADSSEKIEIYDVKSSALGSETTEYGDLGGIGIFNDLGNGVRYAEYEVDTSGGDASPMPQFSVDLNSSSFAHISSGSFFSVGVILTTAKSKDALWYGQKPRAQTAAYLTVQYAVPEPGTLALLMAGLAGVNVARRKSVI